MGQRERRRADVHIPSQVHSNGLAVDRRPGLLAFLARQLNDLTKQSYNKRLCATDRDKLIKSGWQVDEDV